MQRTQAARARFGSFELDLRAGELHGNGRSVLLPDQVLQVLRILVERQGKLVSREELKITLWPNDTVVEFDHGINNTIKRLRKVLDDPAEEPKYVETIPRRGYRLMLPVEWVRNDEPLSWKASENSSDGSAVRPQSEPGLIGRRVSHYRVLDVIGGGGMGMVYKAEDLKLGREVALKFLPPELASDPIALQRFEREARAASSLDHPNICTIHEVEEHERQPFIVMQLLQGETLRDRLSALTIAHQKMALGELLEIAVQICDALQAAHAKGIIHRDIKPANIFVTAAGQAKILDFGLAKSLAAEELPEASLPHDTRRHGAPVSMIVEPTLTRTGLAMGTAGYMSPEQVRGEKLDARTDIFSFGLVLYEMATGQRAFIGETAAVVHDAVLNKVPTPVRELNSTLPARLVSTIDRGLEKDRERRYQSVTEMRVDLLQLKHTKPSPGVPQRLRWYAAAASVLLILMAGLLYRRTHPPIKLTDKDTLVVTNVTNSTGDPLLDDSLEMPLSGELQEAPYINLLNPGKVRETLHSMNVSADARVTPELARTVCLRTNSRAYVTASIADSGNHYQIRLQAADCHSGKTLAMAETQAGDRSRIVRMLGVAGHDLRAALGEPADSLARFAKPLDEQWSSSLEALKVFSQGLRAKHQQGWEAARPFYTRAIELDPEFSLAYLELGDAYDPRYMTQAFTLRDRLSESFRLLTEADYYERVTGELEKARETYHQWVRTYPADIYAHRNFSVLLRALGQSEDALVEAQEAVHLSPDIQTYNELMAAFTYSSRLSEAKAVFEEAKTRGIEHSSLRTQRYHVAWIENDLASMREQIANAPYTVADKDWASERQGETAISQGRFRAARAFYGGMTRSGDSPNLATNLANFALWDVESGNTAQAKERVQKALAANPGIATMKVLALVSARAGDVDQAKQMANNIARESPVGTLVQDYQLPTIRAAIELDAGRAKEAIEILKVSAPYELAEPEIIYGPFGGLYPCYIRGLAYLKLNQGKKAATEFQKLLDHRGLGLGYPTGPLSHLQLARAQAMMGDKAAARKSYQDFLALWKDADPDIPIYIIAKAEYVRLQ